jgi:hypothetical protein
LPVGSERKEHEVCCYIVLSLISADNDRDTRSTRFLQAKLAHLGLAENSCRLPKWMVSARGLSKATRHSTACRVSSIRLHTKLTKICLFVPLLVLWVSFKSVKITHFYTNISRVKLMRPCLPYSMPLART